MDETTKMCANRGGKSVSGHGEKFTLLEGLMNLRSKCKMFLLPERLSRQLFATDGELNVNEVRFQVQLAKYSSVLEMIIKRSKATSKWLLQISVNFLPGSDFQYMRSLKRKKRIGYVHGCNR